MNKENPKKKHIILKKDIALQSLLRAIKINHSIGLELRFMVNQHNVGAQYGYKQS